MANSRYEVAVVGGGPGGYVAGIRLGQRGKKAVVIERAHLGGVCLNWGCIPSKAIIHAAHTKHQVEVFGKVFQGDIKVQAKPLMAWKDKLIQKQRGGIKSLLKANGCDHLEGAATLTGPKTIQVKTPNGGGAQTVEADQIVLATGAAVIEIPGFPFSAPEVGYAKDAVAYDAIPERFVIIGGGVIGCELGMAYAMLGSKVSIVEMTDSLLPGTDPDLLRPVQKQMRALGIEVLTGARAKAWHGSSREVEVEIKGSSRRLSADRVLVAVGFRPNTEGLGLAAAGVQTDERGWVPVDDRCRTNVPNIYAIGDLTGPPLLAHRASYMGEVAADVIAGHPAAFDVRAMPLGVFTEPEIAQAGLTEADARAQYQNVKVGKFPLAALGRAGAMNQTDGVIKVVVDGDTDVVLGVGIAGPSANDLIAEACLAIEMGALAEDLALTVHAHPTLAEGLMEAANAARGEAVHMINRAPRDSAPAKARATP